MNTLINTGGPAFPAPAYAANITDKGMTLRDYFAGQALAGMLALGEFISNAKSWMPEEAYELADAMLAARQGNCKITPTEAGSQFTEKGKNTTPRTDTAVIASGFQSVPFGFQDFARTLETELATARSERDLAITRVASILWSGAIDKRTCGEVQQWADDYTAELTRLRALSDQLSNNLSAVGAAYNDEKARAEKAEAECLEQARLLGISGSEVAALKRPLFRLTNLWHQLFFLLDITEESDSGNTFRPNYISSCRAVDAERMEKILAEAKQLINTGVKNEHL